MAKKKGLISLCFATIYYAVFSIYSIFRVICWPILGRPHKIVEKVKLVERNGPNITVKPSTFVNRMWARIHDDDKRLIKSSIEAKSNFRLGVLIALESVGTDPKIVECIAEQIEMK